MLKRMPLSWTNWFLLLTFALIAFPFAGCTDVADDDTTTASPGPGDDDAPTEENKTPQPGDDDASLGDDDVTYVATTTPGDDDVTSGDDDATVGDDDMTLGDDDATVGDDDATVGDDDATAGDDDATVGDDDATVGDDDVTAGDDDATIGDDDGTAGDDDTSLPDVDLDGFSPPEDCDDQDPVSYPGAFEVCDTRDNDCDGETDEEAADASIWFADEDSDGYGNKASPLEACSQPPGYVSDGTDCNDSDPAIHPSTVWYVDYDKDGYGSEALTLTQCTTPKGYVLNADDCNDTSAAYHPGAAETCSDANDYNCDGSVAYDDSDSDGHPACEDCDDANPTAYPGAPELCDTLDNDCDGEIDEEATNPSTWYLDADGDGFGSKNTTRACTQPEGYVTNANDCDDSNAAVNPDTSWYLDLDGDSYGTEASVLVQCQKPGKYAIQAGDCDDSSTDYFPGAVEDDCTDPHDYNCDGQVAYIDADGDGTAACEDCNDQAADVHPGADEQCDGIDHDCDGAINEPDSVDAPTWFFDADRDGYGSNVSTTQACSAPNGYADNADDCNDGSSAVHPGAAEVCNKVDDDCDGTPDDGLQVPWYLDFDGDGYGSDSRMVEACSAPTPDYVRLGGDCDDSDTAYNPGEAEGCDGLDYNCDGNVDNDDDGDGYPSAECGGDDCDDTDPSIRPEQGGGCALGESCLDILNNGHSVGNDVYLIDPDGYDNGLGPLETFCNMTRDGGGWTLLGKTINSSLTSSERDIIHMGTWNDYTQTGYGDPDPNSKIFWLPLEAWHNLTINHPAWTNLLWLEDSVNNLRMTQFSIGDSSNEYKINWDQKVSGYEDIVDGAVKGMAFTTWDNDNDTWGSNCARDNVGYNGGWWYTSCYQLSMLHANNNLYSWVNNIETPVSYLYIWFREE